MHSKNISKVIRNVYNEFAKLGWYDEGEENYFTNQKNRYHKILEYIFKINPIERNNLLDVGSHMLQFSIIAKELGYDVSCTDVEQFVNNKINDLRLKHFNLPKPKICQLEDYSIPFDSNSFDVIVFSETLEHLNFNPLPVLDEFNRLLKPGGIVIISTPNVARLGNRIKLLLGGNIYTALQDYCYGDPLGVHRREYISTEVEQLLIWSKFSIALSKIKFTYPKNYFLFIIERFVQFVFPTMAGTLYVIGQKNK